MFWLIVILGGTGVAVWLYKVELKRQDEEGSTGEAAGPRRVAH